uniref:Uncharacterized protein n=1 Tax=Meloidogyne enterolobii TaxID=390850 RepID=A0A6V7VV57_MELEN|nr:unnamed protein product [Meloidogyne enterolobii]
MLKLKFDHKFKALINNNFTKNKSYYETSILDESLENIKINKKELLKENIENYKRKLLSSYWKEINLIGYKIELLEKQKVEYLKEKSRVFYIGNKITKITDRKKRHCLNCGSTENKYKYLKEQYLCNPCDMYLYYPTNTGKHRPKEFWFRKNKVNLVVYKLFTVKSSNNKST